LEVNRTIKVPGILSKISKNHSYGTPVGTDEYGETASCDEVLQYIQECNGDGCDYIFHFEGRVEKAGWSSMMSLWTKKILTAIKGSANLIAEKDQLITL
jgi:hypothetical protein